MNYNYYPPEGELIHTQENTSYLSTISGLERAMREGKILEAVAIICDENLNLHVDLCGIKGIIPREECVLTINNEPIKDIAIITRVGKPVCFKVKEITPINGNYKVILSRKDAQIECKNYYLSSLCIGDIVPAVITHLDTFGAFLDIGCGIVSLLCIDCISISRISHPADRLYPAQRLEVVVKSNDVDTGRIYVTLKELLGTWEENAQFFSVGQTVSGIVRSVESYGVFVELTPNLAGLAELRYDSPSLRDLEVGERVSVYIKSILPNKMKIKLVLIDTTMSKAQPAPLKYFITSKDTPRLLSWRYSPESSLRIIESVFE